jgi:hypothetical protein
MSIPHTYLAYFDSLGFETIYDCTEFEKDITWSTLQGRESENKFPGNKLILRAIYNQQRCPEIWLFDSELCLSELLEISQTDPQVLVKSIRDCGKSVFTTTHQTTVTS